MFIILKTLLLYVICFYYCVLTPGTNGGNGNTENLLWETITVSLLQAFIAAGLFAFFDWPTAFVPWVADDGFLGLLGTVGVIAGLWTLIGGLCYPMLHEILEHHKKGLHDREAKDRFVQNQGTLDRIRKEHDAFETLVRTDPQSAMKLLDDAIQKFQDGKENEIGYELFKSEEFLYKQSARVFKILNPKAHARA